MNIGVDIDCTIADFQSALINFHNHHYKTKLRMEDFWTFSFHDVWGGSDEEGRKKVHQFLATKFFKDIKPIKGAVEGIKKLKEMGHSIYIVTSRIPSLEKDTHSWLKKYFPNLIDGIYFSTSHYDLAPGREKKADYCRLLNLDYLIEDDPNYATDCHKGNTKVIMIDWPWNRTHPLPEGVIRVKTWPEIIDILEGVKVA